MVFWGLLYVFFCGNGFWSFLRLSTKDPVTHGCAQEVSYEELYPQEAEDEDDEYAEFEEY